MGKGGNVGKVLRGDLIAFDIDSPELLEIVKNELGSSFGIESGGNGFGVHRYYNCSEWEGNHNQITVEGTDYGSLRNGSSYCLVPPSVHDESGREYQIENDIPVTSVSAQEVSSLLESVGKETANTGRRPAAGSVGSSELPEIPSEYPQRDSEWRTMQSWLEANHLLGELDRTADTDWSGTEFKIAKCLAEAGFSEKSISSVLDRLSHNSKWHSRGESYRTRTVRKAILSACNDEYVDFSNTVDMGASKASERRKTESGSEGTGSEGGENNMPEFTEKESIQVKEGSSDGDRAVEAVRVEGQDGSDTFEFVSIRKGRVQTVELTNGEEGQMIDVDETNGKSVGGTADLDLVIEALQELQEEIN
jgi:hypothetical protein